MLFRSELTHHFHHLQLLVVVKEVMVRLVVQVMVVLEVLVEVQHMEHQ